MDFLASNRCIDVVDQPAAAGLIRTTMVARSRGPCIENKGRDHAVEPIPITNMYFTHLSPYTCLR